VGSPTRDKGFLVRLASEMRHHVLLQTEYSQILDQMLNAADDCRVVQSWNYPVHHHDRVQLQCHLGLEAQTHLDRGLRVQVVVTNSRILIADFADFALLVLVEVEAAAGKKSLLPYRVVADEMRVVWLCPGEKRQVEERPLV
jgi:hypothetical protein